MARVLPSGRVFGEAVALPQIGFAKEAHPMETLQKAATSDLAGLAVAGISRIKDEIDYADRLDAEKRRVAGAQIAERKAEAALGALQEQQTARAAAMEQHEAQRQQRIRTFAEATGQLEALERGEEIDLTWRPVHKQVVAQEPTPGADVAARMVKSERKKGLLGKWDKLERDIYSLERQGKQPYDLYAAQDELTQQINALDDEVIPGVSPMAAKGLLMEGGPVFSEPEYTGPEALEEGALAEAQAALAAAQKAAAVPMQFVPKTMADFRFKVRDLETRLLQAETAEEKQALANQIRQTISQARGAVDVQPESLMEAFTREAGKEAQKTAYDEMTITEKEFLRQMYEASKERRAEARESHMEGMRPHERRRIKALADKAEADAKRRGRLASGYGRARRRLAKGLLPEVSKEIDRQMDKGVRSEKILSWYSRQPSFSKQGRLIVQGIINARNKIAPEVKLLRADIRTEESKAKAKRAEASRDLNSFQSAKQRAIKSAAVLKEFELAAGKALKSVEYNRMREAGISAPVAMELAAVPHLKASENKAAKRLGNELATIAARAFDAYAAARYHDGEADNKRRMAREFGVDPMTEGVDAAPAPTDSEPQELSTPTGVGFTVVP